MSHANEMVIMADGYTPQADVVGLDEHGDIDAVFCGETERELLGHAMHGALRNVTMNCSALCGCDDMIGRCRSTLMTKPRR